MELFFWHNIISPHQAPFMKELAESGHTVTVVSTEVMSDERRRLGWDAPSLGPAHVLINPDQARVLQIVEASGTHAIHFIAGARGTTLGRQAASACRAAKRRMGMITEAPDPRGIGGILRRIKYSWERVTVGSKFDFILAMGQMGMNWFKFCGYSSGRIFPFAYVTEQLLQGCTTASGETFKILFVGRLVTLKGVDLLLRAFSRIPGSRLEIIGDGPEATNLRELAKTLGIAEHIVWHGQMSALRVQASMADANLLVLPSRKDGWGAVVNESLMSGTPVICSDACGAAELIRQEWLGSVFESGNVNELAGVLGDWVDKGQRNPEERERIRSWSQRIEGPAVAGYIEAVIEHVYHGRPRPEAPWRVNLP